MPKLTFFMTIFVVYFLFYCSSGLRKKKEEDVPTGGGTGTQEYDDEDKDSGSEKDDDEEYEYKSGSTALRKSKLAKIKFQLRTPGKAFKIKQLQIAETLQDFVSQNRAPVDCNTDRGKAATDVLSGLSQAHLSLCLAEAESSSIWFGTKYNFNTGKSLAHLDSFGVWVDDSQNGQLRMQICENDRLGLIWQVDTFDREQGILAGKFWQFGDEGQTAAQYHFVRDQGEGIDTFVPQGNVVVRSTYNAMAMLTELTEAKIYTLHSNYSDPELKFTGSAWNCQADKNLTLNHSAKAKEKVTACLAQASQLRQKSISCHN